MATTYVELFTIQVYLQSIILGDNRVINMSTRRNVRYSPLPADEDDDYVNGGRRYDPRRDRRSSLRIRRQPHPCPFH
ncbi:hypothetical protein CCACVL1_13718 [Corchorus capsularis]|uniref:Uncharacterized protein n=1 Tax=Corchorus capsularis TaxID=210143 RepID=A0A1R3I9T9_COCAP|nr:hypothetical protein CCACVL1_13718 [Corchorus capsularis]